MKNWYLVYCKPRGEELAKANLERQGFETYVPMVRQPRRRMGKRIIRIEPLFPRYLFIHLDTVKDNWAPIRSTYGVSRLIRFGMEPAIVPKDLVVLLQARDDVNGLQDLPVEEFERGARVRITDGPMMGYEAVYLAKTSQERVLVLLEIVGKQARLNIEMVKLEAVK